MPDVYLILENGREIDRKNTWSEAKELVHGFSNRVCFRTNGKCKIEEINNKNKISTEDVYVDASMRKSKSSIAGFFGDGDIRNFAYIATETSVPRLELLAIIEAIRRSKNGATIYSDSSFAVMASNLSFSDNWKNSDLIKKLKEDCRKKNIEIKKVHAHSGVYGNEQAHNAASLVLIHNKKENEVYKGSEF